MSFGPAYRRLIKITAGCGLALRATLRQILRTNFNNEGLAKVDEQRIVNQFNQLVEYFQRQSERTKRQQSDKQYRNFFLKGKYAVLEGEADFGRTAQLAMLVQIHELRKRKTLFLKLGIKQTRLLNNEEFRQAAQKIQFCGHPLLFPQLVRPQK